MTSSIPKQLRTKVWESPQEAMTLSLGLSELPRLSDCLVSVEATAEVVFKLYKDVMGWSVLEGQIDAQLAVLCQRCFKPMKLPLSTTFKLALIDEDDEARKLPNDYEPLVVQDGLVNTRDVIEDEILLALPIVSTHKVEDCGAKTKKPNYENADTFTKPNPFGALAKLKEKGPA